MTRCRELTVIDLPPMTTNLAAPAETWMRLELSLVFDTPQSETMVATIHQDLVSYIRTIRLHQLDARAASATSTATSRSAPCCAATVT